MRHASPQLEWLVQVTSIGLWAQVGDAYADSDLGASIG